MGESAVRPLTKSSESSIRATPKPLLAGKDRIVTKVLAPIASLRLTVWLFALSLFLIFCGTLAQVDHGIWNVLHTYFQAALVWIPWQLFVEFAQVFFGLSPKASLGGSFPFPGGLVLGSLLLLNLLAAHLVRFQLSWKRAGVLLLHSGLVVMMVGQLYATFFAVEGMLTVEEGRSANYLELRHATELAIIDPSNPKSDHVFVVPGKRLDKGGVIQSAILPFDVEVVQYLGNSALRELPSDGTGNRATAGLGLQAMAAPAKEASGTSSEVDIPSAYLAFKKKGTGETLGTYLVSVWFSVDDRMQQVKLDGKAYDVSLRFQRAYKPYAVHLIEFRHDKYIGTDIAKNYSSKIRFTDPTHGVDREVLIRMNEPMRYEGETFYQADFLKDGRKGTVLQVVFNEWWILPYVSCGLVAIGMIIHFLLHLSRFLRSISAREVRETNGWQRLLPGLVVAVAGAFLAWMALPPHDTGAMHLTEMAKLPIVAHGRVKPLDTLARTSLTIVSNRQTFKDENGKSGQPAMRWLMDVFTSDLLENKAAFNQEVFRVENDQLVNLLHLKRKPEFYRYSYREIAPNIKKLESEAIRAKKVEPRQRNAFDQKTLELANHLTLFVELAQWHDFLPVPPESPGQEWRTLSQGLIGWPGFAEALAKLAHGQGDDKPAFSLTKAYEEARNSRAEPPAGAFLGLLTAYAQGNAEQFNSRLADYQQQLEELTPKEARIARWETFFNDFAAFYWCSWLYFAAFLLVCFAWLFYPPFARCAFWLTLLLFVVHTWAIVMRMYIQDWRPPVTNLYSSAVFIGWAGVILGLVLESVFRNGLGTAAGAVLGSLTLILAHHLAGSGDTMEMLQAVLDTNFWLATHVVVVNLGYMATFVAGLLGATYVFIGVFTNNLTRELSKTLSQMMYGVVCFATLLSFTGTVLGGIWADQSWGRFWGWDPKENGALMIVLINALFLHARWAGMVKQRGLAVLTLVGSMITAWSYFGTNQLGVGLHSYGFSDELAVGLVAFWAFHAGLIAIGLMPLKWWRSFATPKGTEAQLS